MYMPKDIPKPCVVAVRSARAILTFKRVIEFGLVSGLKFAALLWSEPRAGMVIRGLGPNLLGELDAPWLKLVSTIWICSIMRPFMSSTSHTSLPGLAFSSSACHIAAAKAGSR